MKLLTSEMLPSGTQAAAFVLLAFLAAGTQVSAEPHEYTIDEDHFTMTFEVSHIGYASVIGMFLDARGSFVYDAEEQSVPSGEVVVESDSVFSNHKERDEHLRKDDFLAVDDHPQIVFEVTRFKTTGDKTGELTGDLTLLGETRPVTLDVTLNKAADYPIGHGKYTLGISASTTIKRSEWGMTYALDPKLVGDEVKLRFEFEAIRGGK